jgi:hypothetical protein
MTKKFITEKELSAITGRALQTLRNDRFKGKGFPYIKIGKSVRYDQEVAIAIMEENKVETSSFQPEGNEEDHSLDIQGMANNNKKGTS